MSIGKIALVGTDPFFETSLLDLLKECQFEVDQYEVSAPDLKALERMGEYDLLILSSALARGVDEDSFFSCLLNTTGFLLAEADGEGSEPILEGNFFISDRMSPEEIIFKVNGVVFQSKNLRKSPRIPVQIPVEYDCESHLYQSMITNLSLNGLFVNTLNPPARDSRIKLRFRLTEEGEWIEAVGRVLYSIRYNLEQGIISHPSSNDTKIIAFPGMGVYLEEISNAHQEMIQDYVEENGSG